MLRSRARRSDRGRILDALGKGVEEGKPGPAATKYVSRGLTRSRTDKLSVLAGGAVTSSTSPSPTEPGPARLPNQSAQVGQARLASGEGRGGGSSKVTSLAGHSARAEVSGTTALKAEPEMQLAGGAAGAARPPFTKSDARRTPPRSAPKPRPRATRAKPAANAEISRWCGMARA